MIVDEECIRNSFGLHFFFGEDYMDGEQYIAGLLPIEVEIPQRADRTTQWIKMLTSIFGTGPEGRDFFRIDPDKAVMRNDLAKQYQSVIEHTQRYAPMATRASDNAFRLWMRLEVNSMWFVPMKVTYSPCRVCAKKGTWTFAPRTGLFHAPDDGQGRPRLSKTWRPLWPNDHQSMLMAESHSEIIPKIHEELAKVFEEVKGDTFPDVSEAELENVSFAAFLAEEFGAENDLEDFMEIYWDGAAGEIVAEAARSHSDAIPIPARVLDHLRDTTDMHRPMNASNSLAGSLWHFWDQALSQEFANRRGLYYRGW